MSNRLDTEYWQLVWEKFKSGDRIAFHTIYKEFGNSLFAYGSKITSDKDLLKDAVQDLFIDIYNYGSKLRKPELLEYYLYKSLKRIIFKKLLEKKRFSSIQEIPETTELLLSIEENAFYDESDERLQKLRKVISDLDKPERELLFFKFNSGLTYKEISRLMGIKPNTLQKKVYTILSEIKRKMSQFAVVLMLYAVQHKK